MGIIASTRNHVSSKETGFNNNNNNDDDKNCTYINIHAHTWIPLLVPRLSRLTCSPLNTGVADVSRYMDSRLAIGADIISSVGNRGRGEGRES